jgi:carboxymethylenebutenolidase
MSEPGAADRSALAPRAAPALTQQEIDQRVFDLYPGARHGFHNSSTPRHDEAAARLAWARTIAFFRKQLA